jgi:hypothetical protein
MLDRRAFLKGITGMTAASAFYPVLDPDSLISAIDYNGLSCSVIKDPDSAYVPDRIFCQFEDQKLKAVVAKCAKEINCEIINGASFSPDILAFRSFVKIIDRNFIDREIWQEYIGWYDEFRRDETCIIVDDILSEMPLPVLRYMPSFNLKSAFTLPAIINLIKSLKDVYAESYRRRDLISSIFNNIDSGLIFLDYRKNNFLINKSACELLNISPEEIDYEPYDILLSQIKSPSLSSLLKEQGIVPKTVRGINDALGASGALIVLEKSADLTST